MGSSLVPISNSIHFLDLNKKIAQEYLDKLKTLDIERCTPLYGDKPEDWFYYIYEEDKEIRAIEYHGDYIFDFSIFKNCADFSSIYKFTQLYDNYYSENFISYRKQLYELVKLFGGTEVIYLCDSNNSYLNYVYETYVLERGSYQLAKEKLIERLGPPVTEYKKLVEFPSFDLIGQFYLDTFEDLK